MLEIVIFGCPVCLSCPTNAKSVADLPLSSLVTSKIMELFSKKIEKNRKKNKKSKKKRKKEKKKRVQLTNCATWK